MKKAEMEMWRKFIINRIMTYAIAGMGVMEANVFIDMINEMFDELEKGKK